MGRFPGGLYPFPTERHEEFALAVKSTKEILLSAKVCGYFKVYVAPIRHKGIDTTCLLSAFFDDEDEPLVLTTPLLDDDIKGYFYQLLSSKSFDVFFLDEHSREFLSYNCSLSVPTVSDVRLQNSDFPEPVIDELFSIQKKARHWFATRTHDDDEQAITIQLKRNLYPTDIAVVDMRAENLNYGGSAMHELSTLEREEPGNFQEEDIIRCLTNVFDDNQIYKNPLRTYDKGEVCDILVSAGNQLLFIQAKDNPNIEQVVFADLSRKRSKTKKALKKAIGQTRGAIRYLRRERKIMEFLVNGQQITVNTTGVKVYTVVIVKELFDDERGSYTEKVIQLAKEMSVNCVPFDYSEFYRFCINIGDERDFFKALDILFENALVNSNFPRVEVKPKI